MPLRHAAAISPCADALRHRVDCIIFSAHYYTFAAEACARAISPSDTIAIVLPDAAMPPLRRFRHFFHCAPLSADYADYADAILFSLIFTALELPPCRHYFRYIATS